MNLPWSCSKVFVTHSLLDIIRVPKPFVLVPNRFYRSCRSSLDQTVPHCILNLTGFNDTTPNCLVRCTSVICGPSVHEIEQHVICAKRYGRTPLRRFVRSEVGSAARRSKKSRPFMEAKQRLISACDRMMGCTFNLQSVVARARKFGLPSPELCNEKQF